MITMSPPETVFDEIALCLSGGGYRAASFHLGTLDMLDELGLLPCVKRLSTVSGGTIIGMQYALSVSEGKSFKTFYEDFYAFLKDNNVVQQALDQLYTTPSPSGLNDLSLIRAAAQVYADTLFDNRKFEQFLDDQESQFKEVIFNATEFRIGNSFRFRASNKQNVRIGNRDFSIERSVARQIRLSDIVAASSCFPGGFEPIRFPDDFRWDDIDEIRATLKSGFKDETDNPVSVPLMDGGIFDNQGMDSILLADDIRNPEIDLFIISDTNQRDDAVLDFPVKPRKGWLSLRHIWWIGLALFLLSLLSAIAVSTQFIRKWNETDLSLFAFIGNHPYETLFIYFVPVFLAVAVVTVFFWLHRIVSRKQSVEIAGERFELWNYIRRLTVPDLLDFLEARAASLMALTGNVFLKRIRQLILKSVRATAERRDRVAFNILYDMLLSRPGLIRKDADLEPSIALKEVAERAETMATTLWFADKDDLKNLIICGQATICFSIMRFLLDHRHEEIEQQDSPAFALYEATKQRWMLLKANPNHFLDRPRN